MAVRLIATVVLCAAVLAARAQSFPVDISTGNRALSLDLPEAAFELEDATLSVDIDGYDVTAFARLDGVRLHVDLDVPLETGEHVLSVFVFHAGGDVDVLVETLLDAPVIVGNEWGLNTVFESNYRADEEPAIDYEGVDSVANTAGMSLYGERRAGRWTSGAAVDALYDRANKTLPGGDSWILPSYELYTVYGGEAVDAAARAGNIAVAREDLLFSKFQRRGAALETAAVSNRFEAQAFSVNSLPRNDFSGGLLVPTDSSERSTGLSGAVMLFNNRAQLGAGYIDGKSTLDGAGFNIQNDALVYGGDSWNVSFDAWWLGDSAWLHLEHAESKFDADGLGVGLPASSGDATQASLQLSSSGTLGAGPFEYWSAVLQYQQVGREFYSLGNLSLPGNLEVTSAWFQGGFSSLVLDLEIAEETTNPDSNPLFATQKLERAGASFAWSPTTLNQDSAIWKVLGSPSVSGWFFRTDNSQPPGDALLAGFDVDNRTDDVGVSIMFARDELNWSVEFGTVDYDDRSMTVIDNGFIVYEPFSDSRNRQLSLVAGWTPGERVSFDAFLQRNKLEETDYGDEYRSTSYGVSGNFILVPDTLSLFASLSQGEDRNRFGDPQFIPEHYESQFASMQLNWQVTEAQGAVPAFRLFFKGNYGRNENLGIFLDEDFWALYVGASVNWTGGN